MPSLIKLLDSVLIAVFFDVRAIAGTESFVELDITSHAIQAYFTDESHPIVPWKHPRYQHFYVEASRPDIALPYQWSTSFRQLQAYLDPRNIAMHNQASIDPDPSLTPRRPEAPIIAAPILSADALPVRIGVALIGTLIVFSLIGVARSLNQRAQAR